MYKQQFFIEVIWLPRRKCAADAVLFKSHTNCKKSYAIDRRKIFFALMIHTSNLVYLLGKRGEVWFRKIANLRKK